MKIHVEFSGGMELLFRQQKQMDIDMESSTQLRDLLFCLRDQHLSGDPTLFMSGDSIRPGVLVLINDADWELEGEAEYDLQPNDHIVFLSTLHGG